MNWASTSRDTSHGLWVRSGASSPMTRCSRPPPARPHLAPSACPALPPHPPLPGGASTLKRPVAAAFVMGGALACVQLARAWCGTQVDEDEEISKIENTMLVRLGVMDRVSRVRRCPTPPGDAWLL